MSAVPRTLNESTVNMCSWCKRLFPSSPRHNRAVVGADVRAIFPLSVGHHDQPTYRTVTQRSGRPAFTQTSDSTPLGRPLRGHQMDRMGGETL